MPIIAAEPVTKPQAAVDLAEGEVTGGKRCAEVRSDYEIGVVGDTPMALAEPHFRERAPKQVVVLHGSAMGRSAFGRDQHCTRSV